MNERRLDPRTGEWVTYSTARQDRTFLPPADQCPLCPSSDARATEIPDEPFDVAVFQNRFPAFMPDAPEPTTSAPRSATLGKALGTAEVVVYSPDHQRHLTSMEPEQILRIVDVWADRYAELSTKPEISYVFVFENRGVEMGVTLHHPHGQIYGYPSIPPRVMLELTTARRHIERTGRCVHCDAVAMERSEGARVIVEDRSFVAYVPFAARFPYEVHVISRRHAASLLDLTDAERLSLARTLKGVVRAYDGLFGFPMPYVMVVHQAPTRDPSWLDVSHFHIEFSPPYRTAQKLKYIAGAEIGGGEFLNDAAPEVSAAALRDALNA